MTRRRQDGGDGAKIAALQRLPAGSPAQVSAATTLLRAGRTVDAISAALHVLREADPPGLRAAVLAKYTERDADGVKRDPGGLIRIALLETLRPLALPDDTPLLERATQTYEFLFGEATGDLRAAGLLVLNEVDHELAAYHCVRLLVDGYTSTMSGEPALTAARILAAQGQRLPLYAYLTQATGAVADVTAECLRSQVALPASLLPPLIERYLASEDEIVLLGLFDLLLARDDRAMYRDTIIDFLRATRLLAIFRSLVSTLVAGRDETTIAQLAILAEEEPDATKRAILREALSWR
jgi:hypothetical protein